MDEELTNFCVDKAQSLGAEYAEARMEQTFSNGIILKNGQPQISGFEHNKGIGLRLLVNGRMAFLATNKIDKSSILMQIKQVIFNLEKTKGIQESIGLSSEKAYQKAYEVPQKKKLQDLDPSDRLELLKNIDDAITDSKADVPGRYLSFSDAIVKKHIVNSDGTSIKSTIPITNFLYYITVQQGSKSSQHYWQYGSSGGWEKVLERDFPSLSAKTVQELSQNLKSAVPPPKEKIDLVVGPEVTGIMVHEAAGHPLEGDRILGREAAQAGESFVKRDMLGRTIGSKAVNIRDDPTIPGSFGHYLYDDEGVKAGPRDIIRSGVISEFLTNRDTASALGIKSNASSRADSFLHEPIVRMANTYFVPGDQSEEELIEDIKLGVYMKNFTEWNIDDKRLNQKYVGCISYMIRNGTLAEPVCAPTLEISTPTLWSSVESAANNLEFHAGTCGKGEPMQGIPVWLGGPSVKLKNIKLGKKNE